MNEHAQAVAASDYCVHTHMIPTLESLTELCVAKPEAKLILDDFRAYCRGILEQHGYGDPPDTRRQAALWDNNSKGKRANYPMQMVVTLRCVVCGDPFNRTVSCTRKAKLIYCDRPCCSRNCAARLSNFNNPNRNAKRKRKETTHAE